MLDRQLADHGQTVKLRKGNTAAGEVAVKAFVRGITADEIVGTITQSDKKVTVSPTDLAIFGMPAAGGSVVVDDKPRAIVGSPEILKMDDVIVRINVVVKG
ncbi:hypothetical protein [Neorhizobium galegae]|nr:hypothetical protein [Neorhizobium galegae]